MNIQNDENLEEMVLINLNTEQNENQKKPKGCKRIGIFVTLFGSFCFSASSSVAKVLGMNDYQLFQVVLFRGLCSLLVSSIVLFRDRCIPFIHIRDYDILKWSFLGALLCFFSTCFFYFALNALLITDTLILLSLISVFSTILSRFILKEKITWFKIVGCILLIISVIVSFNPVLLLETNFSDTILWIARLIGSLAALMDSLYIVSTNWLNNKESHYALSSWWQGLIFIILSPFGFLYYPFEPFHNFIDFLLIITVGLTAVIGFFCSNYGSKTENPTVISIIWNFEIIFSLLWQVIIFQKQIEWFQGLAVVIIIIACIISALEKTYTKIP